MRLADELNRHPDLESNQMFIPSEWYEPALPGKRVVRANARKRALPTELLDLQGLGGARTRDHVLKSAIGIRDIT